MLPCALCSIPVGYVPYPSFCVADNSITYSSLRRVARATTRVDPQQGRRGLTPYPTMRTVWAWNRVFAAVRQSPTRQGCLSCRQERLLLRQLRDNGGNACLWAHNSIPMTAKCQKQHDKGLRVWAHAAKTAGLAALHVVAWWTIGMFGDGPLLWGGGLSACFSLPHPLSQRRDGRLFVVFAAVFACVDYRHIFTWTIGIFRENPEIRGGLSAYWRWTIGMRKVDYRHGFGGLSACRMLSEALWRLG